MAEEKKETLGGKTPQEEKQGNRPKEENKPEQKPKEDIKLIVRVASVDLNGKVSIVRALTKIKGIGLRTAKNIGVTFEKETGKSTQEILGKIGEGEVKKLEEIVLEPGKFGIPEWSLNRRKDYDTGENTHLLMADLDLRLRQDVQRLSEIKSYRGFRHTWGLPLRGQRTKSTHRGKGGVIGVTKKDAKVAK